MPLAQPLRAAGQPSLGCALRARLLRESCTVCESSSENEEHSPPSGGDLMVRPLGATSYASAGSASPLIFTATSLTSTDCNVARRVWGRFHDS